MGRFADLLPNSPETANSQRNGSNLTGGSPKSRFSDLLPKGNDPSKVVSMQEMTPEEQEWMRRHEAMEQNRKLSRAGRNLVGQALEPGALQAAGDFELLEALNQAKIFSNKNERNLIYKELRRRQYPDEFIENYINLDKEMGFKQSLIEEIPEMAGGAIGSGVGAFVGRGNPQTAQRYAVAGAGIGAGLAELGKEWFNRMFRPEKKRGAGELIKDTAWTAMSDALGEYGGRMIFRGFRGAPAESELVEGAARLSGKLQEAGERLQPGDMGALAGRTVPNVPTALTPAQATANRLMGTIEEVVDSSFVGGGRLNQIKRIKQPAALKKLVDMDLDEMMTNLIRNMSPAEIGLMADDAIKESNAAFKRVAAQLYSRVDQATQGVQVDTSNMRATASAMLDKIKTGQGIVGSGESRRFLRDVANLSDSVSFEDAAKIRSDLLELVRDFDKTNNSKAKRLASYFATMLDGQMEDAAKKLPDEALKDWRRANQFYKAGKERFGGKIIRKLAMDVDENPELAVRAVFGTPGDEFVSPVTRVKNVKKILLGTTGKTAEELEASRQAWDQLRFGWLQSKIAATVDEDGVLIGKKFQQALNDMGPDALKEMFSPAELQNIQDWATLGRLIQQKKPGTLSTFFMRTLQPVGGAGFVASGKEGMALAVLGGPAVMSRFITSDFGRKWLTTGIVAANKGLEVPAGWIGQYVSGMLRAKKELEGEKAALEKFNQLENWNQMRKDLIRGKEPYDRRRQEELEAFYQKYPTARPPQQ
jgi:uncharacterized protein (DUF2267 family)